jgi:hypothetical protein
VLRIETIGFTNQANGKELLTPITNRVGDKLKLELQQNFASPDPSGPADSKHNSDDREHSSRRALPTKGTQMKSVCTLLGLSADADEPSVHAAVSKLLNRGDIAPDALAALRAEHQSLGEQNQILLGEQSQALLDACGVREEKIRNRLADGLKLLRNRQERLSYLADFGYTPNGQDARATTRVLNRGGAAVRESVTGAAGEGEQALAIKIQNRAGELQGKGLKYDVAWNQARREVLGKNT